MSEVRQMESSLFNSSFLSNDTVKPTGLEDWKREIAEKNQTILEQKLQLQEFYSLKKHMNELLYQSKQLKSKNETLIQEHNLATHKSITKLLTLHQTIQSLSKQLHPALTPELEASILKSYKLVIDEELHHHNTLYQTCIAMEQSFVILSSILEAKLESQQLISKEWRDKYHQCQQQVQQLQTSQLNYDSDLKMRTNLLIKEKQTTQKALQQMTQQMQERERQNVKQVQFLEQQFMEQKETQARLQEEIDQLHASMKELKNEKIRLEQVIQAHEMNYKGQTEELKQQVMKNEMLQQEVNLLKENQFSLFSKRTKSKRSKGESEEEEVKRLMKMIQELLKENYELKEKAQQQQPSFITETQQQKRQEIEMELIAKEQLSDVSLLNRILLQKHNLG